MIKSNKGACFIEGKGGDILFELNHIFATTLEDHPELLTAVVAAWSPALDRVIDKLDTDLLTGMFKMSDTLRERMEDGK